MAAPPPISMGASQGGPAGQVQPEEDIQHGGISAKDAAAEAKAAAGVTAAPAHLAVGSSKLGVFYRLTRSNPTNYDMLVFRTLPADLGLPNHNQDHLARALRDELMPVRSWWIKHWPGAKQQLRRSLENPLWGVPGCINFIDARTRWLDDAVVQATAAGIKQVVLVAAGFDTRAYRLAARGVSFYEVDLPHAMQEKKQLVDKLGWMHPPPAAEGTGADPASGERPAPCVVHVGADLSKDDLATALAGAGFEAREPCLVIIEGLLYYLKQDAVEALLRSVSGLMRAGSRVYFDFMALAALQGRGTFPGFKVTSKAVANKGEAFQSGLEANREAVSAFLAGHGLRLLKFMGPKDMTALMLPHAAWSDKKPPIASFYSYAAAIKP